jgi:hypothetical protein
MVEKGYFVVLPYELVKDLPNLRLAPVGVVPHLARRPRPVVDYSFYQVKQDTESYAPKEAMQFGLALDRLLYEIQYAEKDQGLVFMLKLDISDGFYRTPVRTTDIPTLGIVLPRGESDLPFLLSLWAPHGVDRSTTDLLHNNGNCCRSCQCLFWSMGPSMTSSGRSRKSTTGCDG